MLHWQWAHRISSNHGIISNYSNWTDGIGSWHVLCWRTLWRTEPTVRMRWHQGHRWVPKLAQNLGDWKTCHLPSAKRKYVGWWSKVTHTETPCVAIEHCLFGFLSLASTEHLQLILSQCVSVYVSVYVSVCQCLSVCDSVWQCMCVCVCVFVFEELEPRTRRPVRIYLSTLNSYKI